MRTAAALHTSSCEDDKQMNAGSCFLQQCPLLEAGAPKQCLNLLESAYCRRLRRVFASA